MNKFNFETIIRFGVELYKLYAIKIACTVLNGGNSKKFPIK